MTKASALDAPHVGSRIRRLRRASGKSLRQVAEALEIAPSALSMLENGQTGASLQRLQLIARHFDVTIVNLLAEVPAEAADEAPRIEVVRRAHATAPSMARGRGVVYQLPGAAPRRMLQPALLSFEPGGGYERDKIGHVGEEVVYVLLGDVELHFGEERIELAQGDMAIFRTETPHAFKNASDVGPAMVLAVASPPW